MRYEVIGPKGVILASGLTKRQADTYCANCGGTVRAENPAPRVGSKMTDKEYVTRGAALKGLDLLGPKRGAPGVMVYDWKSGKGVCIVDAKNWAEARQQLDAWNLKTRDNPAPKRKPANSTGYGVVQARRLPFLVEVESPAGWGPLADFTSESEAVKYARAYNAESNARVRVIARGRKG